MRVKAFYKIVCALAYVSFCKCLSGELVGRETRTRCRLEDVFQSIQKLSAPPVVRLGVGVHNSRLLKGGFEPLKSGYTLQHSTAWIGVHCSDQHPRQFDLHERV